MQDLTPLLPDHLQLAQLPTPLQPLNRLSDELGGPQIWLKRDDLTEGTAAGNKIRKLEFTLAAARAAGADTVITCGGVQSNHCRATAVLARYLGLDCHLVLRGDPPPQADGNLLLDQLLGARISYLSTREFRHIDEHLSVLAAEYASQGNTAYCIPVGASDAVGLWGYIKASQELELDFQRHQIQPGYVFSATGSGGTLGGMILGARLLNSSWQPVAVNVSDDRSYFEQKILADIADWGREYPEAGSRLDETVTAEDIHIIEGYKAPGYGQATPEVYELIRRLGQIEGIILDPVYTGKAFLGMISEIEQGRYRDTSDLVFVHTGGIFGNFPLREGFSK